ncbi:MAG TPA: hypothetical protein VHW26_11740 [Solirubrobacteraceae bacterium]|jgi:hypothetical protein|nr:hypothetical protein [Solirubrobacteraceae bacterium]
MTTTCPGRPPGFDGSVARLGATEPGIGPAWEDELRVVCPRPDSSSSRLCANGDPIEFAFVWPAGELRATCDPAPGAAPGARLERARAAGEGRLSVRQRAAVTRLADWAGGAGRYGGWVGSRLTAGQVTRKLYVEIVDAAPWQDWWPTGRLLWSPGSAVPASLAVMAGLDEVDGTLEVYFRVPRIHPDTLCELLSRAGLPPHRRALTAELARLTGQAVRGYLPGRDQGLSIVLAPDGHARALTWYTHAGMLFGPPARARAAYLAAGRRAGWPMETYARLTAADADQATPDHGLAGVRIDRDGGLASSITCGLRPPGGSRR